VKGVRTPVEKKKVKGGCTLSAKGQKGFTPPKFIVGIISRFKNKRVFTSMEFGVLVSTIEAFFVAFSLPQLSALLAVVATVGLSTRVVPEKAKFEDAFTNLALG
jgi:hypothetical protein